MAAPVARCHRCSCGCSCGYHQVGRSIKPTAGGGEGDAMVGVGRVGGGEGDARAMGWRAGVPDEAAVYAAVSPFGLVQP